MIVGLFSTAVWIAPWVLVAYVIGWHRIGLGFVLIVAIGVVTARVFVPRILKRLFPAKSHWAQ